MKVRFVTSIADTRGWYYNINDIVELRDDLAQSFIASGKAVEVQNQCPNCGHPLSDPYEATALAPPGERAVLPPAKKRAS